MTYIINIGNIESRESSIRLQKNGVVLSKSNTANFNWCKFNNDGRLESLLDEGDMMFLGDNDVADKPVLNLLIEDGRITYDLRATGRDYIPLSDEDIMHVIRKKHETAKLFKDKLQTVPLPEKLVEVALITSLLLEKAETFDTSIYNAYTIERARLY